MEVTALARNSPSPVDVVGILPEVVWSSSNTTVAAIGTDGIAAGLGSGTITITATSGSISGSATLTVANRPPLANAGPDQTVEATSSAGAAVTLNGASSSDPDGLALSYSWAGSFGAAYGVSPTLTLSVGTHATMTVSNGTLSASDGVVITIRDTSPPSVPTDLNTYVPNSTQVSMSWKAATDVVGVASYKVYRDGVLIATACGTSFTDSGLPPSTRHSYSVAACDAANNCSVQSRMDTAKTKGK